MSDLNMANLAIKGAAPVRTRPFPAWPVFTEAEAQAAAAVIDSGDWGHAGDSPGSKVDEFREAFSRYFGVDYAFPVTNGSVALEVALRNAGVGPGDEVLTPPTTWVATNLAPLMVGAEPVFVDVSPDNYCLDPDRIEEAITPRTRAIITVHIGGYLCDMQRINRIAERHDLVVIEDCAQAHGSKYQGKLAGTLGQFGCFSFEKSKLMTAGEGGMVITDDRHMGNIVYGLLGEGGRQRDAVFAKGREENAWNYRMTEIQASLLLGQLGRLDSQQKQRAKNAEHLTSRLSEVQGVAPLTQSPEQNYFSYIFKYDSDAFNGVAKNTFMKALEAEGIPLFSSPSHQPPAYRSPGLRLPGKDYSHINCPVAERCFEEEAIGLPATWMLLGGREDMDDIAAAVCRLWENRGELESV
jgi:dTDP-4-amino-4,6-dideoxygalactose transaminase